MRLDAENVDAYALGCAILSAGGGGDPGIGLAMARHALESEGPVEVVSAALLDPDALVMPCGLIGSPTVAQERIWSGSEGERLAGTAARLKEAPVDVLMCYEIAGVNGLLPVLWAARLRSRLLDSDGMGRAYPEMQQQSMHLAGVDASPVVLTDGHGNDIVLHAADNAAAERLARSCTASLGGTCAGALYLMNGSIAQNATIHGSVSNALRLGIAMQSREARWADALADVAGGVVLLEGQISELHWVGGTGFARGFAVVEGRGRRLRLELQNEVLIAIEDGQVMATVPDIITVLDLANGEPVGTERLQYGQRVSVVALPAPAIWWTSEGLHVAGPECFGYKIDYIGTGALKCKVQ